MSLSPSARLGLGLLAASFAGRPEREADVVLLVKNGSSLGFLGADR